jgi:hypothetical protein
MLTLTFENNDTLTIPESAIANFKALNITNNLHFKHGHWVANSTARAVSMDLYVDQLKQLKTMVNNAAPTSNKTALDNLLNDNYQITAFVYDDDQPTYVVWHSANNNENINEHQTITREKTPNGKVLRITIVNKNA